MPIPRRSAALTSLGLVAALLLAACGDDGGSKASTTTAPKAAAAATTVAGASTSSAAGSGDSTPLPAAKLSLVAYSTPQAAYTALIKAFQATPQGKDITFTTSYGASGDQSRAVDAGLEADVVAFSLETDITRLVKDKIVAPDWNSDQYKGIITDSVVSLVVRKGNPKGIKTWDDLIKPGIQVITPNPFTSGGARWNVLAGYGAKSKVGKDDAAGVDYLKQLFGHVPVQDDSGRAALQTFTGGKGDVAISYENEAIFAQQNKQPVDYVIPDDTLLIENPVAVTANSKHAAQAKAFLAFLHTPAAQRIFADNGYRPVVAGVAKADEFPKPAGLFTIADLGGWTALTTKFFDPVKGVLVEVEQKLGVPTKK
ncbi:MAG: sulfate transporter, periplasmic sulfate-binding protein [Acidimicrobiia bacterium]|nr:sulfate transporter, periplasmic sulfate-binding protein [Acidimicrobiia bacterium]